MICVSIAEETLANCLAALKNHPFAEVRMDRMRLTAADVRTIFSRHHNLIATCRPGVFPDDHRKMLLLEAIKAGAAFVDVEVDAPAGYREEVMGCAKAGGCAIIVSFHDHAKTPGREELAATVSACFILGADIAKIACMVHTDADNARLLGLLDDARKIVVVGMGEMGRITRIAASLLGSPFSFACQASGRETADGQIDHETLRTALRALAPDGRGAGER
jgi:3-dehydroquinate dehydratase type I